MKIKKIDEGPQPRTTIGIRKSTHLRLQNYVKGLYPQSPISEIASLAIDTYLDQMIGKKEL